MGKKPKIDDNQMLLPIPGVLYEPRFLESHAGAQILRDPKTAIVELIANAWDAGATEVGISWPDGKGIQNFRISDNGTGMTDEEFRHRWRTLYYNRRVNQGMRVTFPEGSADGLPERVAFGRNGVGRWSGFCFGDEYFVDTSKEGRRNRYKVAKGETEPFDILQIEVDKEAAKQGTRIECPNCRRTSLSPDDVRAEIGMRFLTDPCFNVSVNGNPVVFADINALNLIKMGLDVKGGNSVELIVIDTHEGDRTTKQHGVAWHVGGRLVGSCDWRGVGADDLIDGRRIAAKRFTFIVRADYLANTEAIKKDWSGFEKDNESFLDVAQVVYGKVREHLFSVSEEDRKETLAKAKERNKDTLAAMGPLQREKWTGFVTQVQEKCPSIKAGDIVKLSEVLANLDRAKFGYALLHKLSEYGPDNLDDLHKLLDDWTLDTAKVVLDEIGQRLKLVEELRVRIFDKSTDEVQDLQPLFEKGLWIFGPEFETIEYTSNEGMTRVVQELFKQEAMTASRNRPDFAILPDGTSGLYSYPTYGEDGGEIGTDRLVVVELKKPDVKIGEKEKAQCWRYVKELYKKGLLKPKLSAVQCYVLGLHVESLESSERTEMEGDVVILPMLFNTVLQRAKSRLMKLHERVKNAPFLEAHRQELEEFLAPAEDEQSADLFVKTGS